MIPKDWIVRPLGSCLRYAPEYGINAAAVRYDDSLPTYLRITDISEDYRFRPSPRVSVKHPSVSSFFLCEGDLVFARTGASVGKSYRYDEKDGPLVLQDFLSGYAQILRSLNQFFWHTAFSQVVIGNGSRLCRPAAVSRESMGKNMLCSRSRFPPLSEQRAIAKALSDVDGLLAALEALIAKKRAIKQAAMQQLLTGKTRLPGFSGKWEKRRLGDTFTCLPTGNNPRADLREYGQIGYIWTFAKAEFLDNRSRN